MKPKIILSLLFLLISVGSQAQNVDSLIQVINNQVLSNDEKIQIYEKICSYYTDRETVLLYKYSQIGLELAQKEKNIVSQSWFIGRIAGCYNAWGKQDSAQIYYEKSLDLALESNDLVQQTISYSDVGVFYFLKGQNLTALEYYMKGLEHTQKTGNKKHSMIFLSNIGGVHRALLNSERAIYFLEQAKEIAEEENSEYGMMNVYYDLGQICLGKKETDKALNYIQQAYAMSRIQEDKQFEILSLQALSYIYSSDDLKDYDKAKKYADESMEIAESYGNQRFIKYAWLALSDIYIKLKKYEECEATAIKAWEMDSISFDQTRGITHNIAFANAFMGNADKAFAFSSKYMDANTKYISNSLHENIADMEVKYETEKKELRIASLEKEKQLYTWLGIAGALFAVTLGIVLWLNIRNTRKEKQLIATRSVMDGEMGERTRLARDLHDRLSGNLSAVKIELNNAESLLNVSEQLDHCIEEVRKVAHDIMPTSLKYGMKVALDDFTAKFPNVHFHFFGEETRVEERIEFIVYCCANEMVNNSLRHSGAKNINLQLIQDAKRISLTVQDDGCGFDEKSVQQGLGLKNIRDRVASCNGKINITSSLGKGTEITIELKAKNTRV